MINHANYIAINYPKNEYGESDYPQLLCNYIDKRYLTEFPKGAELLDIGSGKGSYLLGFYRLNFKVSGLDRYPECLDILKDIEVKECDLGRCPFPFGGNSFDVIFAKSVIEHVFNTDYFLSEIYRVLKPSGIAIIMTPAWESQYRFFFNDYTHLKPFTRKGLQNALKINGFEKVEVEYFYQLPFLWRHPFLKVFAKIISLLPDRLSWRDLEEKEHRKLIRFSKEQMLFGTGRKK